MLFPLTMQAMEIKESLQKALQKMNISGYSDIQEKAMPVIEEGKDVLIQSPTGSGKTIAALLPLLNRLEPQGKGTHFPIILLLSPTRELALQTADTVRELLFYTEGFRTVLLTGGVDMNRQVKAYHHGADIVIATPARLLDHIRRHTFKPKKLETLIIDEADEMMKMGFMEDVQSVITALPSHQTIVMSATFPEDLKTIAESILTNPITIENREEQVLKQNISVKTYTVKEKAKLDLLFSLLEKQNQKENKTDKTIIFCNTRKTADFVNKELNRRHFPSASIHSDMDSQERKEIMAEFRKEGTLLCATDVLGRGIDIKEVTRVILYDLPDTKEALLHRIGRGSRDGRASIAILFLKPSEKDKLSWLDSI